MTIRKPKITVADIHAVQALLAGKASEDQQKRAMTWIGAEACGLFELSHQDGEKPLATAFEEGRRYAGMLIMQMKNPETLTAAKKRGTPNGN